MAINFKQIRSIIEKEAIKALGENQKIVLQPPGTTDYNSQPWEGKVAGAAPYTVNAVVPGIKKTDRRTDNPDLTKGQRTAIISGAIAVEPVIGWTCTLADGIVYRVVDVKPVRPGSTTIVYTLTLER